MHTSPRWKIPTLLAAATTVVVSLSGPLTTVGATTTTDPRPATGSVVITLVTGDRVQIDSRGKVTVLSDKDFVRHDGPGGTIVIPVDAVDLLKSGQVDRRLFNVTALAKQGYGDAAGRRLPRIGDRAGLARVAAEQPAAPVRAQAAEQPVKIDMIGRDSRPVLSASEAVIVDLDNADNLHFGNPGDTLMLPPGRYSAFAAVYSAIPGQWRPAMTSVADPEFTVTGPRTLRFDARPGRRVELRVERPAAQITAQRLAAEVVVPGGGWTMTAGDHSELYSVAASAPHLRSYFRVQASRPLASLVITAPTRERIPVEWVTEEYRLQGRHTLEAVNVGHARPEDLAGKNLTGKLAVFTLSAAEADQYGERIGKLVETGATAAVLYLTEQAKISARQGKLPVLLSIDNVAAALTKARTIEVEGRTGSPYEYDLAFPHLGGTLPARVYRPADRELAAVETRLHALADDESIAYTNSNPALGSLDMHGFSTDLPIGGRQLRYLSPMSWHHSVRYGDQGLRSDRVYTAGRTQEAWGKAVLAPSLAGRLDNGEPLVSNNSGTLRALLPLRSDSAAHLGFVGEDWSSRGDIGTTTLWADGQKVGENAEPGIGEFAVPSNAETLRLTAQVERHSTTSWLSTKVSADWTFAADHQGALPLLTIGFDPAVNLANSAAAERSFTIPVAVNYQTGTTGPRPRLRSVEASYDDGATWQPAPLAGGSAGWSATVKHPAAAGFVSLRATANDAAGNKVAVTVIRAYRLHR